MTDDELMAVAYIFKITEIHATAEKSEYGIEEWRIAPSVDELLANLKQRYERENG